MQTTPLILTTIGLSCAGWVLKTLFINPKSAVSIDNGNIVTGTGNLVGIPAYASPEKEQQITYKELALWLWNNPDKEGNGQEVIYQKLSELWAPKKKEATTLAPPIEFEHPELADFYHNRVIGRRFVSGSVLKAAEEILLYLDIHGDCSSLTNYHSLEKERGLSQKSQDVYAKTSLWQHTINTANAMIDLTEKDDLIPLTAKGLIAALGHDLGKIPKYYDQYKTSEPHWVASIGCLENMQTPITIPLWTEIKEAILLHHDKTSKQLPQLLCQADQAARRKELNDEIDHHGPEVIDWVEIKPEETVITVEESIPEPAAVVIPPPTPPAKTPSLKSVPFVSQEQMNLDLSQHIPDNTVPIDGWLMDVPHFVSYIGQFVNGKVPGAADSFWSAIMKEGLIYYRRKDFILAVQSYSEGHLDVESNLINPQATDNLLYSIIKAMDLDSSKPVAMQYLGKRRYTAKFIVSVKGKNAREQSFIPFNAKAFSERFSEIQARGTRKSVDNIEKISWMEE